MQNSMATLAERAYRKIEEMLVTLELPPGSSFTEGDISTKLSIGRTPVREALQRLVTDRLVTSLPRRGLVVVEINISEQLMILETRRVLDSLIASRAARRATESQRSALKKSGELILQAAAQNALQEYMRLDHESDELMEQASQNYYAIRACRPLHIHCRRFWYKYHQNSDLKEMASLHADVFNAVAAANEKSAVETSEKLVAHLMQLNRSVLDSF